MGSCQVGLALRVRLPSVAFLSPHAARAEAILERLTANIGSSRNALEP
jgi:hypothetical protein